VPLPSLDERAAMWRSALNGEAQTGSEAMLTAQFRLTPEQVHRAAAAARRQATAEDREVDTGHLEAGADGFRQNLARFAKDRLFRGIRLGSAAIVAGITRPAFVDDLRRLADADLMLDAIGSAAMITHRPP